MARAVFFGDENRVNKAIHMPGEYSELKRPHALDGKSYFSKAYSGTVTTDLDSGGLAPTITADWLIDRIRWANKLRQICQVVPMPGKTWQIPKMTAGDTVYYQLEGYSAYSESGATQATTGYTEPTITHATMTAYKMAGITGWTTELQEDSVIPIPEMMFKELADSMADYEELAMIQGDESYGHTLTGAVGGGFADMNTSNVGDVRYMFDGLIVLTPGSASGYGTPDDASPENIIDGENTKLTKESLDQLLAVIEDNNFTCTDMFMKSNVAARLRNTTEWEEFQRLDAIGNRAALIKGYVGTFYTADIFRTNKIPVGAGFGTGTTDTYVLGFDRKEPFIGDRRKINFVSKHLFERDVEEIRTTERYGFIVRHNEALGHIYDVQNAA